MSEVTIRKDLAKQYKDIYTKKFLEELELQNLPATLVHEILNRNRTFIPAGSLKINDLASS